MTKAISALLLVAFLLSQLNGCSLVGLGIGSVIDSQNSQRVTPVSKSKLEGVRQGSQLFVHLDNGDSLNGIYYGFEHGYNEKEASHWALLTEQKPEGVILPKLGESITIADKRGRESNYEFSGFGSKQVFVKSSAGAKQVEIPLKAMSRLTDSQGNVTDGKTIRRLISEGKILLPSTISAIYLGGKITGNQLSPTSRKETVDTVRVDMKRVSEIQGKLKTNKKLTWLLIGAGFDLAMIGLVVAFAASGGLDMNLSPY